MLYFNHKLPKRIRTLYISLWQILTLIQTSHLRIPKLGDVVVAHLGLERKAHMAPPS